MSADAVFRRRPAAGRGPGAPKPASGVSWGWRIAGALALLLLLAASATRTQATSLLALMTGALILTAARYWLLAWPTLLSIVAGAILFIPIRRYTLGGGLPFALEPYRILIALVFVAWILALAVDPKTRFRRTRLEPAVITLGVAILLSLAANTDRVAALPGEVIKQVSFFASFLAVMYMTAGALTSREKLDRFIVLLAAGGTLVAFLALFEWATGQNLFNRLDRFIPLLDFVPGSTPSTPGRGGHPRAYGSAQHAIALGAALIMILPLVLYLHRRTGKTIWMAAGGVLAMGALATGSRTAILMMIVNLIVFLWLKRSATVRLLPWLLPLVIACQAVMPGTLGSFKGMLFPKDGLVAEEQAGEGTGTGRLADVGPSLQEWGTSPLVGRGFGTRKPDGAGKQRGSDRILDDQWLSSLIEIGGLGVFALIWLFIRAVRMLRLRARCDDDDGWLLSCLAAMLTAFAVGMLTYDAFSFIQVTFLAFITLGLAGAARTLIVADAPGPQPPGALATMSSQSVRLNGNAKFSLSERNT